jgi:hypothetical protein
MLNFVNVLAFGVLEIVECLEGIVEGVCVHLIHASSYFLLLRSLFGLVFIMLVLECNVEIF